MASRPEGAGAGLRGGLAQALQRAWLTRGPLAVSLLPLAALFGAVTAIRRHLYRQGWLSTQELPVPVVVVGNLIAGGAGKTPAVIALVALLRRRGFSPGVISRGYGRGDDAVAGVEPGSNVADAGDEALLLRLATGGPVFVGRDRVAAGREMLRRHPTVDIVVSDDGLQHLRLARTAQVLVFDERGAGNGWLLPAGPLRESLPRKVPKRSVVLYNAPEASTPLPGSLARRSLARPVGLVDWHAGRHGNGCDFSELRGKPLVAAAGLAHPDRFFAMLRQIGLSFTPLPLPDHWRYARLPWPPGTADVIVTEKDAVKIDPGRLGMTRVWVAALDFAPDADFEAALLSLLPDARRRPAGSTPAPTARSDDGNTTS